MLRPGYFSPKHKDIGDYLLDKVHGKVMDEMKSGLKGKDGVLVQDGWSDIHNCPVIASSLHVEGKSYFMSATETGTNKKTAQYCTSVATEAIKEVKELYECKITGVVTDNEKKMQENLETMDDDERLRKNNERLLKIGFKKYQEIHQIIGQRIQKLEEQAYGWLDDILEEAREAFGKSDNALLPKTPSAKRKEKKRKSSISRRRIQLDDGQDDYVEPTSKKNSRTTKGSKKKAAAQEHSDEDTETENDVNTRKAISLNIDQEFSKQEAPVGRRTRAASRAATTSRARNTRSNKTKKKTKGVAEPILVLKDSLRCENVDSTPDRVPPLPETANVVSSCITPNTNSRKESMKRSADTEAGPVNDVVILHGTPETNTAKRQKSFKTPIQNFNSMNVKERVQAYEEIVLISPLSSANVAQVTQNTNNNSPQDNTPRYSPVTPRTPATVTRKSVSPKTPEQIESPNVPMETRLSRKLSLTSSVESPMTAISQSPRQHLSGQKRRSSRQPVRVSVNRKSLKHGKRLPSVEARNMSKPSKPRTRLRLKKKQKEPESVSSEAADTTTSSTVCDYIDAEVIDGSDSHEEVVSKTTSTIADDDENNADVSDMEADTPEPVKSKSTRTKTRAKMNNSEQQETAESSTRTRTRQVSRTEPQQVVTTTDSAQSSDEKTGEDNDEELRSNKDSGLGSGDRMLSGSSTEPERPRMTRSKMRKPPVQQPSSMDTDDSDGIVASPRANPPRATRTKTRKRQHEEGSDGEPRQPKRSCTETSILSGREHTPTNTNDEQSSDDNYISTCPPGKVVRPKIFTHPYPSSANKPPNLNPGNLRSFIHRNSPAPKPTLKEIQEKKKKELLEKERKNEERIRRQKEEHQRQMDEIRKKRALKMKRVEEIREQNKKKQQEQQQELEKRLAEKRHLTNKIKEDRLKEEKAKHKIRVQKAEVAEERRKQEEDERKRKLKEQLEAERAHAELLQRKKEQEEQERQRKIAEERQREKERLAEVEKREREEAEKLRQIEEEKKLEWQKRREERERALALERAEKERQELEKKKEKELQQKREMDRLREQERLRQAEEERRRELERKHEEEMKRMVEKHNQALGANTTQAKTLPKPNLNTTQTLADSSNKKNSYEMTPPNPMHNYNIEDLNSGDETDDDEAPRKKIPDWAQGQEFKALLVKQLYNPPDLNKIFPPIQPPDLNEMFVRKRARWNNRTSSAHWTSPIQKTWDSIRK